MNTPDAIGSALEAWRASVPPANLDRVAPYYHYAKDFSEAQSIVTLSAPDALVGLSRKLDPDSKDPAEQLRLALQRHISDNKLSVVHLVREDTLGNLPTEERRLEGQRMSDTNRNGGSVSFLLIEAGVRILPFLKDRVSILLEGVGAYQEMNASEAPDMPIWSAYYHRLIPERRLVAERVSGALISLRDRENATNRAESANFFAQL